ncbi:hypothetical protein BKA00_004482 [Actinomadura coerulea]|uniref:Uncharacterized protein n=1 Tax=Actinomadura coerulea TaxID=46159 RepID=A0A7X0G1B1_9ACTN|nr:hypothetical protein [Actinomadura coerulea]MBB6397568.1 hypothetical protein [Actinomadura coerulea]GGQ03498.1 hypothetical protein GCM10010187_19350 [Actinomadura coerulea]
MPCRAVALSTVLAAALGAAALLLTTPPADPARASAERAGEMFACELVEPRYPQVFGRNCDPGRWGPLSDFTVIDRRDDSTYRCRTGWAEGPPRVSGQSCLAQRG